MKGFCFVYEVIQRQHHMVFLFEVVEKQFRNFVYSSSHQKLLIEIMGTLLPPQ